MGWTALGGFLPSVIACSLGAFAATAVDMTDPQTALEWLLPGWFNPVFLLAVVLGAISINAITAYSAGLALQAVGIRIRRSLSVIVDAIVAVSLTLHALLVSNFLDTVSNVPQPTRRPARPRRGRLPLILASAPPFRAGVKAILGQETRSRSALRLRGDGQPGRCWFSMYCLTTVRGAPPHDPAK